MFACAIVYWTGTRQLNKSALIDFYVQLPELPYHY